jgi:D-glycero-D-manno-heptose 1,7-bisphosphate phosphatase
MCEVIELAGGVIDGIFFCPHGPDDGCACRKPRSGLLEAISSEFEISLTGVPLVGDSLKDIQVARQCGCIPYLVRTGKGETTLAAMAPAERKNLRVVADLGEAVQAILDERRQ